MHEIFSIDRFKILRGKRARCSFQGESLERAGQSADALENTNSAVFRNIWPPKILIKSRNISTNLPYFPAFPVFNRILLCKFNGFSLAIQEVWT
jgi:hypothetical protein